MLNKMILQCRLCADPELRQTKSGVSVCSFRVAWSEKVKDNETKLFLDCVAWRSTAELVAKYFTKGKELMVEGKLNSRSYEDKQGNNRSVIELTVDAIHFCGKKDAAAPAQDKYRPAGQPVDVSAVGFDEIDDDEDVPF